MAAAVGLLPGRTSGGGWVAHSRLFLFFFLGATWEDSDKRGVCGPLFYFFLLSVMCLMGTGRAHPSPTHDQ